VVAVREVIVQRKLTLEDVCVRVVRAPAVFRPEIFPHLDVALARVFR
jgi:hypothetical protein